MGVKTRAFLKNGNRDFNNILDSFENQEVKLLSAGADQQLTADDSGKLIVFNAAAATLVILPEPVLGMKFSFVTAIAATGDHEIRAKNDGHGFVGGVIVNSTTAGNADCFSANANGADDFITMNGSTGGGLPGSFITCTAILGTSAAGTWVVTGTLVGSGTVTTPFATS